MQDYKKENLLCILPFDHRSSFTKNMLGIEGREPTAQEVEKIKEEKEIIYEAFKKAISEMIPKEDAAILVDEEFGGEILEDAKNEGYTIILTVEKSGQKEFHFEYGDDFIEHVKKYNPTFIKALIHYNPAGDKELNVRQTNKLHLLSQFCREKGYKFLIEPLVSPTEEQLASSSQIEFDKNVRPGLTVKMIEELQNAGVEPDIWKIEGLDTKEEYENVVRQARINGRGTVGIVVLGRAAEESEVMHWLKTGAPVDGIVGFAVGRTIFWNPLVSYTSGQITKEEAVEQININYQKFYKAFTDARKK